jgi:uncharacterized protein YwqG
MDVDARAEALFEQYKRPAVLLHRPYPPHSARPGNSHFGGLPTLPPSLEWPRTAAGVPLHFLCQVDCGEIDWRTELPDRGILYVFGRDDEEQIWGSEEPQEDCRILYAPGASGPIGATAAPADLPPIGWGYPRSAFPDVVLEVEPARRLHNLWPILPLPMDTFPDQGGLPGVVEDADENLRRLRREMAKRARLRHFWPWVRHFPPSAGPAADQPVWDRYGELLPLHRARAFEEATGVKVIEDDACESQPGQGRRIFADETFPQHWIFIHYFSRVALRRTRPIPPSNDLAAALAMSEAAARLDSEARSWFDRSCAVPLDSAVGEADRRDFRAWAGTIEIRAGQPAPGFRGQAWTFTAAIPVIREWAGDPARAASVSPSVYEAMTDFFHTNHLQRGAEKDWYGFQFAQMLGLPPASQQAVSAEESDICLLNLASDSGLGWSFGDAGEATFWISPEDLAARDFSRVRGVIEGY